MLSIKLVDKAGMAILLLEMGMSEMKEGFIAMRACAR